MTSFLTCSAMAALSASACLIFWASSSANFFSSRSSLALSSLTSAARSLSCAAQKDGNTSRDDKMMTMVLMDTPFAIVVADEFGGILFALLLVVFVERLQKSG